MESLQVCTEWKTYYKDEDGKLHFRVSDPKYLEAVHSLNDLYTEGYLDKEWVTLTSDLRNQKLAAGNVFAYAGAYWDVWTANASLNPDDR